MPTTPDSPPSRWPRYLPKQFSIGALLLLVTVVALGFWWLAQPRGEGITEYQARKVKIGMTSAEVLAILGKPLDEGPDESDFLLFYRVKVSLLSSYNLFFQVDGTNGKVSSIRYFTNFELAKIRDEVKAARFPLAK